MIIKKTLVQKGFRLDSKMCNDLDVLCKYTGCNQNDLVICALQKLFVENANYYVVEEVIKSFNISGNTSSITLLECGLKFVCDQRHGLIVVFANTSVVKVGTELIFPHFSNDKDFIVDLKNTFEKLNKQGYNAVAYLLVKNQDDTDDLNDRLLERLQGLNKYDDLSKWAERRFNYIAL